MQLSAAIVMCMKRCIQNNIFMLILIMCILLFWWFRLHLVPFIYRKMYTKFRTEKCCITMIFSFISQARIKLLS